jgi:NAD kinase
MPSFRRIIIVTKRTQLQEMLDRYVTEAQARFYIEHMGLSFSEYERAHSAYSTALETLKEVMPREPRHQSIDKSFLPTFAFGEADLIVTLGNNGLVVNAAKYAEGRPIIGVNADSAKEEGIVAPFEPEDAGRQIELALVEECGTVDVTMAQAKLNDGQRLLGFNDLFIGHKTHVSARYGIEFDGNAEQHSSSGIIVATGAGSTGWMKSVIAGSLGVVKSLVPDFAALPGTIGQRIDWSADELRFMVREPWSSRSSQAGLVFGTITPEKRLKLISQMPESGVIFSDGVEQDAVSFNSGAVAEIGLADKKAVLIVPDKTFPGSSQTPFF